MKTILDYMFKLSINWLDSWRHFKYFHLEIGYGGLIFSYALGNWGGELSFSYDFLSLLLQSCMLTILWLQGCASRTQMFPTSAKPA